MRYVEGHNIFICYRRAEAMCLAVPAQVKEINGIHAKLDYGGIIREANISLVTPKIGDYVIVHAGYAIQILDPEEAEKTLDVWNEYFEFLDRFDEASEQAGESTTVSD